MGKMFLRLFQRKMPKTGLLILLTAALISIAYAQVYEFDNCGATGRYGPDPGDCNYNNFSVDIIGEGIQQWTVPETGMYMITAEGARGGYYPDIYDNGDPFRPGYGAKLVAKFQLEENDNLKILVGQMGQFQGDSGESGVGGGGGTFITTTDDEPILIAGGGNAGGPYGTDDFSDIGQHAEASDIRGEGTGVPDRGDSGAGFETDGQAGDAYPGPSSFINGGVGGAADNSIGVGGFGGGGGSSGWSSHGGGGGYYGGDGCNECYDFPSRSGTGRTRRGSTSFMNAEATAISRETGYNEGHGRVKIELVESSISEFCNFRGSFNECIMNQTNELQNRQYNVSSIFEARENAVFEAFNGPATLQIENTTKISGLWRGSIRIEAERPRIQSGAEFRPQGEKIVIGK